MQRSLSGFCSMRQFVPELPTGLCGTVAALGALRARPSVSVKGYDLSPRGLSNLYHFQLAHGYCGANGAQNIFQTFATVEAIASGKHTLVSYADYTRERFIGDVRAFAGLRAIIVEYANGQALTSDEHGLHYHFDSIGAIDSERPVEGLDGGYATCDGDSAENANPARPNPPIWHTLPTLLLAEPIAYIVCA